MYLPYFGYLLGRCIIVNNYFYGKTFSCTTTRGSGLSRLIKDEEFLEFAIDNLSEMFEYIAQGNLNVRIHRDITGLSDEPCSG